MDAATTLRLALSQMAAQHPDVFRHVTRYGHRYDNASSRQIDCDSDPVVPWRHGRDVMKAILQVSQRLDLAKFVTCKTLQTF